jgi:hypothetical protein
MRTAFKWDVFLSYAHDDREVALKLKEAPTRQQLRVWMDDNLEIGDRLTEQINSALQSSRFGVVLESVPLSCRRHDEPGIWPLYSPASNHQAEVIWLSALPRVKGRASLQ